MATLRRDTPAQGVLRLLLDRPERRNAVDGALLDALEDALEAPEEPIVVLGSTDPRAFCAGGDLSLPPAELEPVSDRLFALYAHLVMLPTVLVAAVDGAAVGAGAQLLLAADLRIAGPGTRISFAGAGSGLAVGTWGLPGLVGWGRAMDLCLTGRTVTASEAAAIGLVDRLEPDPGPAAVALAAALASAPDGVPASVKRLVRRGGSTLVDRVQDERAVNADSLHVDAGSRRPGSRP